MKNLFYLMAVVVALYSCNGGTSATDDSTKTDSTATTDASQQLATDAVVADPSMQPPAEPEPGNAKLSFEKTEHDFGKISQDKNVEYTFKFKNNGTEPLIISEARGSCGCTVPSYSKEPIPVGEAGEITVSFDPKGKSGIQRKTVTVTANTNPARTTLQVVSDIQGEPATAK